MIRRIFWFGAGTGFGFGMAVKLSRIVKRAPSSAAARATTTAFETGRTLADAVREGREAMAEREVELRTRLQASGRLERADGDRGAPRANR